MTQQNSTVNLLIQDANGQSQVLKVVQSAPGSKLASHLIKNNFSGQPVKTVYKTGATSESGQNIYPAGSQVFAFKGDASKLGSRIVHLQPVVGQKLDSQTLQKLCISTSQLQQSSQGLINNTSYKLLQPQKSPKIAPQQQTSHQQGKSNKTFLISPILDHTGARKRHDVDSEYSQPEYKRRKTEKLGKGLRHFSMKVCEKVRKKGTTSYNEVADELVAEFTNPSNLSNSSAEQYDQKNIRRRVYDALNVLMAMNIISKEKKEIRWLGLPTNSLQECLQLEKEKQRKIDSIKQKKQQLRDLIYQQISFKNLVERNREHQQHHGVPPINSTIPLPFIIVNTDKKTSVECSISNDKMEYSFSFDDMFEINDDIEVLKRIGMLMGLDKGEISEENIRKAKSMLPKSLEKYVEQLAHGNEDPELDNELPSVGAGPSCSTFIKIDPGNIPSEFVETQLHCDTSHQSSAYSDPLSPNNLHDFTDDEPEESDDLSSDIDIN